MVSLGFKGVGGYFIPANASEGHVGYMRATHAADLARSPNSNLFNDLFTIIWVAFIFV
jgi:hypothetical protein